MKSEIKHIVYLMLENRSLDQLLGWLYECDEDKVVNIPKQEMPSYKGLKEHTYYNLDKNNEKHFVLRGVDHMNVPQHDPHEGYQNVNFQLFNTEFNLSCKNTPKMGGFYQDFASYDSHIDEIMQSYTPDDLPVINGLAKSFAISDYYFSSVPTQTNCNRAFAASGNSLGMNKKGQLEGFVNNRNFGLLLPHFSQPVGKQFNQKTMWNVLSDHGFDKSSDWMHYHSHGNWLEDFVGLEGYSYTRDIMEQLQDKKFDQHFDDIDIFFDKAKAGKLPKFSFLEPDWGLKFTVLGKDYGVNGNDYHPPSNLIPGEEFLKKVYESLTCNKKAWDNTLLIINFDEHGGTYDHVPPPGCAKQPWESNGTPIPDMTEFNFDFKRFGVRVPLILVSPRVKENTVFRAEGDVPYDHTSVIATILTLFDIPKESWELGARTANAPIFTNIFEDNPIRQDVPIVEVNKNPKLIEGIEKKTPPNDIHLRFAHSLLQRVLEHKGLSKEDADHLNLPKLVEANTVGELSNILKDILTQLKNH